MFHFPHSAFSTLRIFHTPRFPHSAFSTLRVFHTPHSALRTPHFPLNHLGVILRDDFSSLRRPSRKAIMISRKKMDTAITFGFVKHQIGLEFQNFTPSLRYTSRPRSAEESLATTTTTTTTTSENNRFNDQNNSSARASRFLVHFFDVHCTATA